MELDTTQLLLVGALVAGLLLLLLMRRLKRPVDRFDDEDLFEGAQEPESSSEGVLDVAEEAKAQRKRRKRETRGNGACSHFWEVTGFPPDRIGTHVNLSCKKCGAKKTVTVEESGPMLRERDDVREAVRRARGE